LIFAAGKIFLLFLPGIPTVFLAPLRDIQSKGFAKEYRDPPPSLYREGWYS
jgi:hypothetical protein